MNALYSFRNFAVGLLPGLADLYEDLRFLRYLGQWRREGCSVPFPGLLKRGLIMAEARRMKAEILVETGTYLGDTTWFFRHAVRRGFTIEIDHKLALLAQRRFRRWKHIQVMEGDSGTVLAQVVPQVDGPALYWLDGHYTPGIGGRGSEDCPLWRELAIIFKHGRRDFSILIDDARCFGNLAGYPTIDEVKEFLGKQATNHEFRVESDVMFFVLCTTATQP